jgi:prepilin-type N-terminal cleavage/methylation domain-containing protein
MTSGGQSTATRRAVSSIQERLSGEAGFTLIELLVVMQVIAILTVVALPSFVSMETNARVATAQSNVRSAVTAADAYYLDTVKNSAPGTFGGLSGAKLRLETPGVGPNVKAGAKTVTTANDTFCIQDSEDAGKTYYRFEGGTGGTNTIVLGACPAAYNVS